MQVDRSFIAGFLVLGFAIFIVGALTGMAAIAMIPLSVDAANIGMLLFVLGLVSGMLAVALVLVVMNFREVKNPS